MLAACGDGEAPSIDAAVTVDATSAFDAALDAAAPDAIPRAAVLIDCADATGLIQHTAEVTDAQKGYVPTGDATIDVGHVVKWGYAGGGVEHSITSVDGFFDSGLFTEHGTFICVRFDAPRRLPVPLLGASGQRRAGRHPRALISGGRRRGPRGPACPRARHPRARPGTRPPTPRSPPDRHP